MALVRSLSYSGAEFSALSIFLNCAPLHLYNDNHKIIMMEHGDDDVLKFSFCFSALECFGRVLYGNWCLPACPPVSLLSSWLISCPYDPPHPFPQQSLEIDLSGWPTFQPNIELFSLPNLLCLSLPCQLGCSTLIKSYSTFRTTVPHACYSELITHCVCARPKKDELKQLSPTTTVIKITPLLLDHCLVSPEAPWPTLDVFLCPFFVASLSTYYSGYSGG